MSAAFEAAVKEKAEEKPKLSMASLSDMLAGVAKQ